MGRRGHVWQRGRGQFYCTMGGRQIPLGFDRDAAEREFHRLKLEGKEAAKRGVTLLGLVDVYMDYVERELEPSTADVYKRRLAAFMAHAGKNTPAADIRPKHVTTWFNAHPTWGQNHRRACVATIKSMFAWAQDQGYLDENPVRKLTKPGPVYRESVLTSAQAQAIIDAARNEAFRDFLIALRNTGCRPIEIWSLTADRVDLGGGTWQVRNKTRRNTGEQYRTVYLNNTMIELSRRLVRRHKTGLVFRNTQGKPFTRKNIVERFRWLRARMKEEGTEIGPEGVAYSFRHLFITDALERGIPPTTVAELVGHKNLDMIMRVYSKLKHRTDHLREAARAATEPPTKTS